MVGHYSLKYVSLSSTSVVTFPWQPVRHRGWTHILSGAEVMAALLNELTENSLNQKSKRRLSLEIIQLKSAPLLPAVAMEISPTIFGWIQHRSRGNMWRMRMCLCEWLCQCVGASLFVWVPVRKYVLHARFLCHTAINYIENCLLITGMLS